MKPYIMNYSETIDIINPSIMSNANDVTTRTFTIETDDHDEVYSCATMITEETENDDKDELLLHGTIVTNTIENSDRDEYSFLSTMETRELEPSDHDKIAYLMTEATIITKQSEAIDADEYNT